MLISVIVATYNRCEDLKKFLDTLLTQEIPQDFTYEIIIIDNNSKDMTKDVIDNYSGRFPLGRLNYLFEQRQGKCFALNTAISRSQGDVLVFTDDDVVLPREWYGTINDFVKNMEFDAACGRVLPQYPQGIPDWVKQNNDLLSGPIVSYDYGTEIKPYDQRSMLPLIGANMIVKRRLFDEVGLFNTNLGPGTGTFGDDTEMCLRWEKRNKKLFYAGNVLVWHPVIKERTGLNYIAKWNIASGKYLVVKDKDSSDNKIVLFCGIPRHLFRKMMVHCIKLIPGLFNRRIFLNNWVLLFREIGAIQAYKQLGNSRT